MFPLFFPHHPCPVCLRGPKAERMNKIPHRDHCISEKTFSYQHRLAVVRGKCLCDPGWQPLVRILSKCSWEQWWKQYAGSICLGTRAQEAKKEEHRAFHSIGHSAVFSTVKFCFVLFFLYVSYLLLGLISVSLSLLPSLVWLPESTHST